MNIYNSYKTVTIVLLSLLLSVSAFATQGALSGVFSVSATKKVQFSQGNLQYQASTKTWRFAANQYDYIGSSGNNESVSSTSSNWMDLFGYGTSGYGTSYPYKTDRGKLGHWGVYIGDGYGGDANISGTNYDWGVYCKISNGGNQAGLWRTLTSSEWNYLLSSRSNASSKRTYATVNNVKGLILLPDSWTLPTGISMSITCSSFTTNKYTTSQWAKLQTAGAVFLPNAGYRSWDSSVREDNYSGYYWTATFHSTKCDEVENCAYILYCPSSDRNTIYGTGIKAPMVTYSRKSSPCGEGANFNCYCGHSVRLVQDATISYTITFNPNGGTVSPTSKNVNTGSTYGTLPTPTRTGYTFDGWYTAASGGTKIESTTTVSITANQTLYAHWIPINYTITTSATNGSVIGGGTYAYNASTTLSATPADCYAFVRWSDGNTSNPRTITVTGNATYTAIFEKMQYTISTAPDNAEHGATEAAEKE